jgi:hypothetical protein
MKKILLYGIDDATADVYQNIAESHDIEMDIVGDDALDATVGKLFEISDDLDTRAATFPDQYMIFQEVEVPELLRLLKEFKAAGKEYEGIKVMRTKTNETWALRHLLTEAAKEQALSKKVIVLQELVKSCNSLDMTQMDPKDRQDFKEALMTAFMFLQQGQYTEEQLDHVTSALTDGLKKAKKMYN